MFCSKCGNEIFDQAVVCPFCKEPTRNMNPEIEKLIDNSEDDAAVYMRACELMKCDSSAKVKAALLKFKKIENFGDSRQKIIECENKIQSLVQIEDIKKKKHVKNDIISTVIALVLVAVGTTAFFGILFLVLR